MVRRPRRYKLWIAVLIAVVIAALFVVNKIRGPLVSVTAAEKRELVQTLVSNGKVLAPAKVRIGSTTLAVVDHVDCVAGQQVKKGELLLQLKAEEVQAAVAQARAGVEAAQIRRQQLRRVRAPAAAEQLKQAEVALNQTQLEFERSSKLLSQGAITQADFDKVRSNLALGQSRYQGASLQVDSASVAGVEYRLASTEVAQAQAALAAANARLAQTSITAPAAGTIIMRDVEPGDVVQPGRILLILARDGATEILVPFDEKNLSLLQLGQGAQVAADAFPTQRFQAKVRYLAPAVDEQRGTLDARLLVEQPPSFLRTDMTVSVEVEVARRAAALSVPSEAVRDLNSPRPWILILQHGLLERREVKVGLRGDAWIEITSGLPEGTWVVLADQAELKDGERARPEHAGEAS